MLVGMSAIDGFTQSQRMVKYKDKIYDTVSVRSDIHYSDAANSLDTPNDYLADIYEPKHDSSMRRPLIIWMHGGGFKYGTKKTRDISLWSEEFAKRGYVCAAINYRLSKKRPLKKFPDLVEGCLDAVKDLQTAIDFFKRNQHEFRIDTSRIIAAGSSSGAMAALHAVYSSPAEMMRLINKQGYDTLSNIHNTSNIFAVISFWGALFDTNWLSNAKVPLVCVHGTKDRIVRFDHKGPINGSLAIHRVADSLHIPNTLIVFPGYGHELQKHFNPLFAGRKAKRRWKEAADEAAVFLYKELIRK